MRIITAAAHLDAPSETAPDTHIATQLPLDELTRHHPVRSLFAVKVLDASNLSITLRLKWRQPSVQAGAVISGALGCVVDHAARLAAQPVLSECHVVESELHAHRAIVGNTLLVTARIIDAHADCATFHCDIHCLDEERYVWVADSQGTLASLTE